MTEQTEKTDIKSLSWEELTERFRGEGLPAYRAGQVYQWLHEKQVRSFDEMTNLPLLMRQQLKDAYDLVVLKQADLKSSAIDGTRKYLFRLPYGLPFLRVHPGRPGQESGRL